MTAGDPTEAHATDRLAARERGFRMLAITVAGLFTAFATLGAVFLWYDSTARWVTHTHLVRAGITDVMLTLTEAESAQRGYLLTGDRAFIARLEGAKQNTLAGLQAVEQLTRDNPEQQARVARLKTQMALRLGVIDQTVQARRASGDAVAAIRILREGRGVASMTEIRRIIAEMDASEARLEAARAQRAAAIRTLVVLSMAGFAIILALLFIRAQRDLSLDREAEAENAERLGKLLADRTLLLDEVNHRVKNSLQQIASVVRLQSRNVKADEARDALEKTLSRIMAVGRVHEQLYRAGGEVGAFDAGRYAEALARELVESLGEGVELETDVEPALLDLRQAVPLALILNELITNALKYGRSTDRPCRIRVTFGTQGEDFRLSVSDNGAGLPDGFMPKSHKSLGMRAIDALARQLQGRFLVEEQEVGAGFAVVFPRSTA